jgi:hypothetical protein
MLGMIIAALAACVPALTQRDPERRAVETGVVAAAHQIVEAVREKAPGRILAHVASGGIPCIDSVVPRAKFKADIEAKGTWYNSYFFDPAVFNEKFRDLATPTSLAELVANGKDLQYKVQFQKFPTASSFSNPCVMITASDRKGKHVLCFYVEGGQFWLRDGPKCD